MTTSDLDSGDAPGARREPQLPSPKEYAEFIQGIELLDVRLVSSHAASRAIRPEASGLRLEVRYGDEIARLDTADMHAPDDVEQYAFEAYPQLKVVATRGEGQEAVGEIEVRLGLRYKSALEPTDGFLKIFSQVNLQVNAWPYLREFVQQTITRFGWTPLVLPTLKTAPPRQRKAKDAAGAPEKTGSQGEP